MTINTITGASPDASSHSTTGIDLESRIKQQRATLLEKLGTLRGDVRPEAVETRGKVKARLADLAHILKWGVIDDWANLSAPMVNTLEQWITASARQLAAKNDPP